MTLPVQVSSTSHQLLQALSCPVCSGELAWSTSKAHCGLCGRSYPIVDEIPILLPDARQDMEASTMPAVGALSAHKLHQIEFYAGEDPEFETTRPHGTPSFYAWLLAEKFRRSVSVLGDLQGRTILTVCAGSGMDSEFLARAGGSVIASDISLDAAKRTAARARHFHVQILPIVADTERLPFADRSVDIAYVHDGLHHLEDPRKGLAEMMRIATYGVSITEPCDAAVTKLAVRARLADAVEEAGNRVERLRTDEIARCLEQNAFGAIHVDRYAMYYKHRPGPVMRTLSLPGVFPVARAGWRAANAALGRFGNKLAVQATRT